VPASWRQGDVAVAEDVPQAASTSTAHVSTGAMIHRVRLIDNSRRIPATPELATLHGPDIGPETGRAEAIERRCVAL
jgi:hypothetical protein